MLTSTMPEKGSSETTSLSSSAEPASMTKAPARSPANEKACLMRGSRFSITISNVCLTSCSATCGGTLVLPAFVNTRNCMAMPPVVRAISTPQAQLTAPRFASSYLLSYQQQQTSAHDA